MASHQLTENEKALILQLETFRDLVQKWASATTDQKRPLRTVINEQLIVVAEIVEAAGCRSRVTFPSQLAAGVSLDPFDDIYTIAYSYRMHAFALDMVEKAIGVIKAGKFEVGENRSSQRQSNDVTDSSNSVFVVHGHDELARVTTARFLEQLHLNPIVLHEQTNSGLTIIEKLEKWSDVRYAVVLLTPDDTGKAIVDTGDARLRARQNVILELGFFLGKLGRKNVVALVKGELETPSDYDGVLYIQLDSGGGWKLKLANELKGAGLDIDLNRVASSS